MIPVPKTFLYGEDYLTAGIALAIASGKTHGRLSNETLKKVSVNRKIVENIVEKGEAVYGINTGFGPLCTTKISKAETKILQTNILKSHSVGVGAPISGEIAKLMLILKAHSLAKGHSGIAVTTLERILWHLKNDAIPVVPSQGSVGASGDLAPLSHLFLPLIGLGKVVYKNEILETSQLFNKLELKPLELGPKEGLALINGTQFIAAHAVKVVEKLHSCLSQADIIGAMMVEGLQGVVGSDAFLDEPDGALFEPNLFLSEIDAFRDSRIQRKPELLEQREAAVGLLRGFVERSLSSWRLNDSLAGSACW